MKATTNNPVSFLATGLLTILLLTGCDRTAQDTSDIIQSHQTRSEAYEKQGQYKAAIIEAKNIIKKDPQNPLGYLQLANLFLTLGSGKAAIELLEPQITDNTPATTHLLLADAYAQYGKYFSADKALTAYLSGGGDPSNIDYQLLTIKSLAGRNQIDAALNKLKQIVKENPDVLDAQILLAKLYYSQQQLDHSKPIIANVLQKDPQQAEALYLSAQLAYLQNNLDFAEKQLTSALIALPESDIIKPLRTQVLSQLSTVLVEQGRTAEALIYSKLLASENPGSREAKNKLTQALEFLQANDIEKAEKLLIELNEQYPNHDPSAIYLGLVNFHLGKLESADNLLGSHIDPENASPKLIETTALTKLKLNKYAEAINMLDKALQTYPDNEQLLTLYGLTALKTDDLKEKATTALEKAVAINPDQIQTRTRLALHYIENGKKELGIAHLEKSIKKAPTDVNAVAFYSQAMLQANQGAEAKQAIETLLQHSPEDVNALNLAARFALLSKEFKLAQSRFTKVIDLQPDNLEARLSLASIALKKSDAETAIKHYQHAINSNPSTPLSYKGLITAYEINKQPEQGLAALKQLWEQHKDKTPVPGYVLAEYYAQKNNMDQAFAYFNAGKKLGEDSPLTPPLGATLYYRQAKQSFEQGDYSASRRALMAGTQYAPSNLKVLALLAETEIQADQPDEASKIIAEISRISPESPLVHILTGKLAEHGNDTEAANKAYRAAWALQPGNLAASSLYYSLLKAGKTIDAQAFLTQWSEKLPDSSQPILIRALAAQSNGEYPQATRLYESLVDKDTRNPVVLNNLAWLYFSAQDSRAAEIAEIAYQLAPTNYAIVDTYGWILFKTGDVAKGIELLQLAADMSPENKEIQEHLATAKAALEN